MKSRRCGRKRGHQHAEGRSAAEGCLNTRCGGSLRGLVLAAHPATDTFLRQFLLYQGFHCSGKGREICWEETVSGGGGSVWQAGGGGGGAALLYIRERGAIFIYLDVSSPITLFSTAPWRWLGRTTRTWQLRYIHKYWYIFLIDCHSSFSPVESGILH